jgi:hypothetical protein
MILDYDRWEVRIRPKFGAILIQITFSNEDGGVRYGYPYRTSTTELKG